LAKSLWQQDQYGNKNALEQDHKDRCMYDPGLVMKLEYFDLWATKKEHVCTAIQLLVKHFLIIAVIL